MPKKKHGLYLCKDCEIDFIVKAHLRLNSRNPYCPICGDGILIEKIKDIWIERPHIYHKKYTPHEDDIIIESRKRGIVVQDIVIEGRTNSSIQRRWYRLRERGLCQ